MNRKLHSNRFLCISFVFSLVFVLTESFGQSAQKAEEAFTIENYYKVKWGFADEFIQLWKTNHYPLLKKAAEAGDIISIVAEQPILHSGEDTRWDFRVIITFKNASCAFDYGLTEQYKKQLYPDLAKLAKEEKYRFELLLAHWDIMTERVDLSK